MWRNFKYLATNIFGYANLLAKPTDYTYSFNNSCDSNNVRSNYLNREYARNPPSCRLYSSNPFGRLLATLRERKKKLEKERLKLSRLLTDNVLQNWFAPGHARIGEVRITNGKLSIIEPRDSQSRFVDEAIKVLSVGYPDVWNLWVKAKAQSLEEINRIKALWNKFQKTVEDQIKNLGLPLVKWEQGLGKPPPKYFCLTAILDAIYSEVNHYLAEGKWSARPLYVRQEGESFRLFWARNCLAESPENNDLQSLKTTVENMMDAEKVSEELVKPMRNKADEEEMAKIFADKLKEIIKEVELGYPLRSIDLILKNH